MFETLKVVDGVPFALTRHLARLRRSLELLGLALDEPDADLAAAARKVCESGSREAPVGSLRITVTSGDGPMGSGRGRNRPTVAVFGGPGSRWDRTTGVAIVPWRRNEHSAVAGAKTTSYAENVRALAAAKAAGGTEAIFANTAGALCEGTGSNVFVAVDGSLYTPSLSTGCLAGITRALVLESGHGTERDDLTLDDLRNADEAFLTSSTRDVQPIATVDGAALRAAPGPLTAAARDAFAALQANDLDP
ncbi:MAG TPA: aminotransferase class IV [Acidimicrobiales bacterium]|nr:aminotransferase class IV [Acidimicrobiales bacterium]